MACSTVSHWVEEALHLHLRLVDGREVDGVPVVVGDAGLTLRRDDGREETLEWRQIDDVSTPRTGS